MPDQLAGSTSGIPLWLLKATALALGACFGSFANVVIYRVPRHLSIVRPGSACPRCGHMIRWYENIPVLSWIFLRGRCSSCHEPISIRYPLVELLVAVLSLAALFVGLSHGDGLQGSAGEIAALWFFPFSLIFLLVCIIFIDLEHWIIPHVLTITGIALGIIRAVVMGDLVGVTWLESLIGMAAGALPIVLIIEVYFRLTGREGMGYGDVMMMAMAGAWFGYISLPFILLASSLQGILGSVPILLSKKRPVPPWEAGPDAQAPEPGATDVTDPGVDSGTAVDNEDVPELQTAPTVPSAARHMAIPFGPFIALSIFEWLFFQDFIREFITKF